MAEENKHPPTTEEQTPPEMPGKAPKMEQAEIPDVGGGPAPSAKVIDLSAVRSTPEKDAPTDIPKKTEAPSVSVTEYSKREWEKPMPEPEKPKPRRVNLLIDIQERMRQGKGPAYERWAKVYNLKQMAAALQYLKEHQLFEYDDLAAKTDAATEWFHTLAGDIQQTEAELSRVSDLMAAVVQYAKTRPAFDGYKAAKYSWKYLAEHEAELADYRAAKATMAELLGGEKLPKMDVLKEKRRQLAARKKALYLEYRKAQQDMRELVAVKGSVDHLRGLTDNQRNKEQTR